MMSNLSPATAATGSATPGDIRPADDQVTDSQNEIEQANIENSQQQVRHVNYHKDVITSEDASFMIKR